MLAAAGIVVTETSTPISAPDLAEVSESIPATPAKQATMNENSSGLEMKSVSAVLRCWRSRSRRSRSRLQNSVKRKAAVIPTGKPTASALSERRATSRRRSTSATQRPGERAELGADDHRADDQDRRVEEDPDRGDQAGEHHEGEEGPGELDVLRGPRLDLLPDDGVGRDAPVRARSARRAASEICESISSIAIEPSGRRRAPAGRRSITLASSRATSQRITSPCGLRAAPSRKITLQAEAAASSRSRTCSA